MTKLTKRLRRSQTDKVIAGVCGGIGEYTDIDPVVIRLIWLLVTVFTAFGPGILCYLIAWIVIPNTVYAPSKVITPEPPKEAEPVEAHVVNDTPEV